MGQGGVRRLWQGLKALFARGDRDATLLRMERLARAQLGLAVERDTAKLLLRMFDRHGNRLTLSPDRLAIGLAALPDESSKDALVLAFLHEALEKAETAVPPGPYDRVYPFLRPAGAMALAARQAGAQGTLPSLQAWEGLDVIIGLLKTDGINFLSLEEWQEMGLDRAELEAMAQESLERLSGEVTWRDCPGEIWMVAAALPTGLTPSLLLLPGCFQALAEAQGDLLIIVPVEGMLFVAAASDALSLPTLRAILQVNLEQPIFSPDLFLWHDGKISILTD